MANEMIAPVQEQLVSLEQHLPGTITTAVTAAVTAAVAQAWKREGRRRGAPEPGDASPLTRWDALSYSAGVMTVAALIGLAKLLGWF